MKKMIRKNTVFSLLLIAITSVISTPIFAAPVLNGIAIHSELSKEQFLAGLYVETTSDKANGILYSQEEKAIQVRVLADKFSTRRFKRMWIEGMAINSSPAELEKHAGHMAKFNKLMKIKLAKHDIFAVTRGKDVVTVSLNGAKLGEIDDLKFFDLLLRTWVGPVPLSSEFRKALLTAGQLDADLLNRYETTTPNDERIAATENAVASRNLASVKIAQPSLPASNKLKLEIAKPDISIAVADELVGNTISIDLPEIPQSDGIVIAPPVLAGNDESTEYVNDTLETSEATPEVAIADTANSAPASVVMKDETPEDSVIESIFDDDEEDDELTPEQIITIASYYPKLVKWTQKNIQYPTRAMDRDQEGSVRVRITVNKKGKFKGVEMLEKAKHELLNKAARAAAKRSSPYPKIPESMNQEEFSFTMRMTFRLPPKG